MTITDSQATSIGRPTFKRHDNLFIGGVWVPAEGAPLPVVVDSGNEEPIGEVYAASIAQVDLAVSFAGRAQPAWSQLARTDRATQLRRLHSELLKRADEIASLVAAEVGMPWRLARNIQVGLPLTVLESFARLLELPEVVEHIGNSLILKHPVGVVAAITPWNYPLHQAIAKVGAALAAGCTVVLKPSGLAPLTAFVLAEAAEAASLPAGTLNIVSGPGAAIGARLASHPGVNMISFTGSTAAGINVSALAASTVKRVALELGGKSANVILDDADLEKAVRTGVNNAFLNSGQTCTAWTRMLVPHQLLEDVKDLAREAVLRLPLGDPFDESTRLGPLVSKAQVDQAQRYIAIGESEGASILVGGVGKPPGLERGFYCQPTIFTGVTPEMTIAQDEIFGPVLSIISYRDDADALDIANSTAYGLAGAVWSKDEDRAVSFASAMRTGSVDINGGRFNPLAPFGGWGKSGIGRELGQYGLDEFLEVKAIQR